MFGKTDIEVLLSLILQIILKQKLPLSQIPMHITVTILFLIHILYQKQNQKLVLWFSVLQI